MRGKAEVRGRPGASGRIEDADDGPTGRAVDQVGLLGAELCQALGGDSLEDGGVGLEDRIGDRPVDDQLVDAQLGVAVAKSTKASTESSGRSGVKPLSMIFCSSPAVPALVDTGLGEPFDLPADRLERVGRRTASVGDLGVTGRHPGLAVPGGQPEPARSGGRHRERQPRPLHTAGDVAHLVRGVVRALVGDDVLGQQPVQQRDELGEAVGPLPRRPGLLTERGGVEAVAMRRRCPA